MNQGILQAEIDSDIGPQGTPRFKPGDIVVFMPRYRKYNEHDTALAGLTGRIMDYSDLPNVALRRKGEQHFIRGFIFCADQRDLELAE